MQIFFARYVNLTFYQPAKGLFLIGVKGEILTESEHVYQYIWQQESNKIT